MGELTDKINPIFDEYWNINQTVTKARGISADLSNDKDHLNLDISSKWNSPCRNS